LSTEAEMNTRIGILLMIVGGVALVVALMPEIAGSVLFAGLILAVAYVGIWLR